MIRVNRPKRIPKKLRDEGKSSDLVNRQTIDSNPTAEIKITNEIYGHKSIKTVLKKAHHKKCCYCEKDQKGENGAIEHFRPKAGYYILDRTEVLNKPAYYWLGYTWSNLLFVCSDCNGKKGNVFPLQNESTRAKTYQDDITKETPLLIDPAGPNDPRDHIYFEGPLPRGKTEFGRRTVRICELDRSDLMEDRLTLISDIDARLSILRKKKFHSKAVVAKAVNYIKRSVTPKAKFSATSIDYLKQLKHRKVLTQNSILIN